MSTAAGKLLQITLVRHGRPNHHNRRWCSPAQMRDWIDGYNRALVACDGLPDSLTPLAREAAQVLSSPVSRCVQSRRHLVGERHCLSAELFSEAHLPYSDWRVPVLPAIVWRILFRAAWFCGYARHTESIRDSDRRARQAADQLIALAEAEGSVLLVGHGIMNILIARHLRQRGWQGPRLLVLKPYWHASSYRFPAAKATTTGP